MYVRIVVDMGLRETRLLCGVRVNSLGGERHFLDVSESTIKI